MTQFEDFVSATQETDATAPELVLPAGTGPQQAFDALVVMFGGADDRSTVRLVVGDAELGAVHRDTLLDAVGTTTKSGFGEGDGLWLPGAVTSGSLAELACPVPGCPSPHKFVPFYDDDDPPICSIHSGTTLQRIT
jgi:hypothetical protein